MASGSHRYRVFGFLGGPLGLGHAARLTLQTLRGSGRRVEAHDVGPMMRLPLRVFLPPLGAPPVVEKSAVNVFHLNPHDLRHYPKSWSSMLGPADLNVFVPFWELETLPKRWLGWLRASDCVLAASHFIEDACRAAVPNQRVLHYPLTSLAKPTAPRRDDFGILPEVTAFVIAMDWQSDPSRKNPVLGVRAFREAFPNERDVQLVLKLRNLPKELDDPDRVALLDALAMDPRIRLIDETMPHDDVLALYASCDGLISLHRSEGLGLHLMEAMSLERCVLATAYSGNMDFMDEECSWLVRADMVPVASSNPVYRAAIAEQSHRWAEPRLGEAVRALREIKANPELRKARAKRARLRIEQRDAEFRAANTFAQLEASGPALGRSTRELFAFGRREVVKSVAEAVGRRVRYKLGLPV